MILVTGATGQAGSEVVRALLRRGQQVRALVRDRERAARVLGDGAELWEGDLADPASVRAALDGVTQVFLSCGDDPRRVAWETALIDAAAERPVRRIVKLSSLAAEPGSPVAFWDWHGQVELHLRASSVPAVVLRCSFFMSNLLAAAGQVAGTGRLVAPAGAARIAMIDPRDVGAAAAAVLTTPGHDGRTYVLTGPEAVTYADVAQALSAATGRDVGFVDVADEDAQQALARAGLPAFAAEQVVRIFALARQGAADRVTSTVRELTGEPPRDVAAFARDHATRFAPAPLQEINKALVRRIFEEVIPAGDAAAMRELVAPDFLDHDPLPGQPAGAAGAEYVVATMHGAHPDLRFTIDDLVAEDDRVTIRWTLHGTNTGPLLGRPPTGRRVELAAIVIFRVADGRLAERWAGWKPGRAPAPAPAG